MNLCIITDDESYQKKLKNMLSNSFPKAKFFYASNPKKFREALEKGCDAAIIDYSVSWANGIQILKEIRKSMPFAAIAMIIDASMREVAAEAMKRGLDDYVIKGEEEEIANAIKMAVEREETRKKEAYLSAIVENAKEAVIGVDSTGKIIYVNKAAENIFGWKAEELIGKKMSVMAVDTKKQMEEWKKAIREGGARFETLRKDKNGNAIPVLMTVVPFKDEKGNLLFSSGIMVDIREIKEYQNKIEHLNELLKAIRGINQIITREKDEESLLEKSCNLLYKVKGYKMICISYGGKDYWRGDEKFYNELKKIKTRRIKKLDGEYVFIKNFRKNDVNGKLCVVRSKKFDNEEIELLKEVSGDISFALHSIKIERKKEEAEEKYRMIAELANEGICIDDKNEKIVFTNKAFAKTLGYEVKELLNKDILSLVYKEDREKIKKEIEKRRKGKASRYKIRFLTKDGKIKTFLVSSVPLYEDDNFIGSLSVNLDITEQLELERKFEAVFEGALDAIFIEDLDGNILDVNKAACNLLGYSKEELTKMNVADIVPPEIRKRLPELINEYLEKGGITAEAINIDKNGNAIPVEISTTLVDIARNKRVVAIVRDIRQRKKMEHALKESEEKYRNLVENVPLGIFVISLKDRAIVYLNEYGMKEILIKEKDGIKIYNEYKKEGKVNLEVINKLLGKRESQKIEKVIEEALKDKKVAIEIKTKGGRRLRLHFLPYIYKGKPAVLGIANDITDLRMAEEELRKNLEYLQRFHDATVDRELKMIELKKKLRECEEKLKIK